MADIWLHRVKRWRHVIVSCSIGTLINVLLSSLYPGVNHCLL